MATAPDATAARAERLSPPSVQPAGGSQTEEREVEALRRNVERPREGAEARVQPQPARRVERPQIRDVILELPRHPTLRYDKRPLTAISCIAVHHTALPTYVGPERIAQAHVDETLSRGKKAWPGIGYHYFIPEDGEILQTQPVDRRSYHVGRHNHYSVGVVFAGSFMNGELPTARQIQAGGRLIAWLLQEFDIPLSNMLGHREFSHNNTACPGSEWLGGARWRDILVAEIERVQTETAPYHYVLFPTGEAMVTTMAEAADYFEKFKPNAGTRLEDASQARYVTLIGSGLTAEEEQRLADAGVEIDRLDDSEAISAAQRLLQLAHDGRRFRSPLES